MPSCSMLIKVCMLDLVCCYWALLTNNSEASIIWSYVMDPLSPRPYSFLSLTINKNVSSYDSIQQCLVWSVCVSISKLYTFQRSQGNTNTKLENRAWRWSLRLESSCSVKKATAKIDTKMQLWEIQHQYFRSIYHSILKAIGCTKTTKNLTINKQYNKAIIMVSTNGNDVMKYIVGIDYSCIFLSLFKNHFMQKFSQ